MKILLLFTYNTSLEIWNNIGILDRETLIYKQLISIGVNVSFLTYGNNKEFKYSPKLGEIKVYPVHELIKSKYRFIPFFKSIILPLRLKNLFKNIDIIKSNQLEGSWVTWLSKFLYRKKIIVRGGYERFRNYLALSRIKKNQNIIQYLFKYIKIYIPEYISYRIADAIILTSDSDIEFIIKAFKLKKKKKKIFQIANYIDINLFKPLEYKQKEKHVLFIGRLHPEKNLDNLLKAFKELNGFSLSIIGKGPYEEYLKEWKEKFNINIKYWGVIPNDKLPEIINQHQIFILPSFFEGNPKTLLESMSCGLACIGTNVRGINNIINHKENGYLCNTDSQSIKKAILTIVNDKELRKHIGKGARDYIISNHSLKYIIEKEYTVYEKILTKNRIV